MSREVVLSVDELTVNRSKKEILRVPQFLIQKGEFLAITGPNGAGKSTLLKALAFLEEAEGKIVFNGQPVQGKAKRLAARRRMAMVFQDPLLLSGTAIDNITVGLKLRGIDRPTRLHRATYWLEKLNIAHLAERDAKTLSGGEAQRVSIARAMALEPDVLFLDEPFTYLDVPTKAALVSELKQILTETGTTTLMVTHDLSDVPFLADRIVVLMEGSIRQIGPVGEVLAHPKSRQVAEFLGIENIWQGSIGRDNVGDRHFSIEGAAGELVLASVEEFSGNVPLGNPVQACIRPEHIIVFAERPEAPGGPNLFNGKIETVYPYGYYYRLKINAGFMLTAMVGAVELPQLPKQGDPVWVKVPPDKIHIIPPVIR